MRGQQCPTRDYEIRCKGRKNFLNRQILRMWPTGPARFILNLIGPVGI